ncbi:hypothetical protein FYL58_23580 [Klebsiella aerogenes]|nr:hypothetical protein [Klebsiella aerogenes]EIW9500512.1 hypothetical protein [Klebsiella aerogenes]
MHKVHEFAFVFNFSVCQPAPVLARLGAPDATALKMPHKAGRRGGESIARQRWCALLKIIV